VDPLVIVFGLGVGVLVGLTGIGGGSLMTPLLLIVIGTQPVVAIGTDIAYGALTKTVGGWQHLRSGAVDLGVSKWLAFGSVPGSLAGVVLVESLPSPPDEALLWGVERLARSVPAGGLRPALGAAMLASALGVASKAGLDLPAYAIVGPPLLALGLAYWLSRGRAPRAEAARTV
jgi:hypothetical protein